MNNYILKFSIRWRYILDSLECNPGHYGFIFWIDLKSKEVNNTRSKTENLDQYIEEVVYKSKDTKRNRVVYKCKFDGCNKKCSKRWNLIDHIKMHLGVKPYECDQCGARFTQKGNLKKHMKVHLMPSLNQRKVHKCTHCSKSYTERYNLVHHMQSHCK